MYIEDLAINENFLSTHHIDQIYNAFVHYCNLEENRLSADRYKILSKQLYTQQQGLNYALDEVKILEKFKCIDLNRDLTVDFQDFSKFIILNLKFLTGDLSKGRKPEMLSLPLTEQEIISFHCIIKDILFPLEYNNPFFLSDKMRMFLNKFNPYFSNFYNKYGEIKRMDPRAKLEFFSNNFTKIFPKENVNTLHLLLGSEDGNNNFNGVIELNEIVKSLDLLENHYEVFFYLTEIFNFLQVLINNQILDFTINLFFKYNVESNAKFFTRILKIFRRVYACFIKIDQLLQICKEQDIRVNSVFSIDAFYNLFLKFENFYIAKIISNLDFLKNKSNNYYYLNQIVLFGLEFAKRSKENLLIFFESYGYLEILYANTNYLVNSDNYSFTMTNENRADNLNSNSGGLENTQSESSSSSRISLNPETQKQGLLDINTLVNGKASDPKYLINSNTINANNKNCENFHFYQIRKIILFCVKLTQIIFGYKSDYVSKLDRELELPIAKLRYIAEITMRFFYNTNDTVVEESFFILMTLLVNDDVNLEYDFLNSTINKIINNPNQIHFYNLLLKANLKNAKKTLQINSILNAKYINVIKELIFLEPSDPKNLLMNNNSNNSNQNSSNLSILNINVFKDFTDILHILQLKSFDKAQVKELLFMNIKSFAFDVFEVIFKNDSIIKIKNESFAAETSRGGKNFNDNNNNNNNINNPDSFFLLNNQIFKVILDLIVLLMQAEKDFTSLTILKRNFIDCICSNLDLFVSKNRFYAEILRNDVNSANENFDLVIVQKALSIFNDIIDFDHTQIKVDFFIKFFNFDFLTTLKKIFDCFYFIYKSKLEADRNNPNSSWIVFYKFYQTIENDKFVSFMHQIFTIIFRLLTIFDEFFFSLYIRKINPNSHFDTSHIEYFNPESQINKNFIIQFTKFNKFKGQSSKLENFNSSTAINSLMLENKNLHNLNKNLNSNFIESNFNNIKCVNKADIENEINYLNIQHIMSQTSSFNEIFLTRYIFQNYNFREVCGLCENIYVDFDSKIMELFSENTILKGGLVASQHKQRGSLSFAANPSTKALNQSFIDLPRSCSIRNIKLILQTPEERYESKAQILKIDNVLNYTYSQLKNQIKMLYSQEYEIYSFSHSKNLKILINSTEDLIAAFKEEKDFNNQLKQQEKISQTLQSPGIIPDLVGNVSKIDSSAFAQSAAANEFELHLYLEKSCKELLSKGENLSVCPYCRIQHKISNEFYKKFCESKSNYYLMCSKCQKFTFLKFINLLTNINSCMNLEQELWNLFPNSQHSRSQQSFIAAGDNPNPIQISSNNLDLSENYLSQPPLHSNIIRQQQLNTKNNNNLISINRNNLPVANLNSASNNDLNYNTNFIQSKSNNSLLASVGRNINNNTLNFSGSNLPLSNYSSINNNNLISNLNNMNMKSINRQNMNFSSNSPNPNFINTLSRTNLMPYNNAANNQNIAVTSSNLNNKFISNSAGDYNLLNPKINIASPYSGRDSIQINEDSFDDNNAVSNSERTKKINFNQDLSNNLGFSGKVNNNNSVKLNNISEFNLGNQDIPPITNNLSKNNLNLNFDDNYKSNNIKKQKPNTVDNNLLMNNSNLQK